MSPISSAKLVLLSATALFTLPSYANCLPANTILNTFTNGTGDSKHFIVRAPKTEWILNIDWQHPPKPSDYRDLELKEIYLVRNGDTKFVNTVICTYNNKLDASKSKADLPQDLHVDLYQNGKLTVDSYILYTGVVNDQARWSGQPPRTHLRCEKSNRDFANECGGFEFTAHNQLNRYWQEAYNSCYWYKPKCGGIVWEHNYKAAMAALASGPMQPRCSKDTCELEIAEMNKVVTEAAKYLSLCWKNIAWQNRQYNSPL